jgi:hypothetical protein
MASVTCRLMLLGAVGKFRIINGRSRGTIAGRLFLLLISQAIDIQERHDGKA